MIQGSLAIVTETTDSRRWRVVCYRLGTISSGEKSSRRIETIQRSSSPGKQTLHKDAALFSFGSSASHLQLPGPNR